MQVTEGEQRLFLGNKLVTSHVSRVLLLTALIDISEDGEVVNEHDNTDHKDNNSHYVGPS